MKLSLGYLLLLPSIAIGRPLSSCSLQRDCISFTIEETTDKTCNDLSCLWKVCLKYDTSLEGCEKEGSISHACDGGDDDNCFRDESLTNKGWDMKEIAPFDNLESMCVYVPKGEDAKFLLKDGRTCSGFESFVVGEHSMAQCTPSKEKTCTGNKPGVECWWMVSTPFGSCDTALPTLPDPTTSPTSPPLQDPAACVNAVDGFSLERDCGGSNFDLTSLEVGEASKGHVTYRINNTFGHDLKWIQVVYRGGNTGKLATSRKSALAIGEKTQFITSQCVEGYASIDVYIAQTMVHENKNVCNGWDPESDVCLYKIKIACNLCDISPAIVSPTGNPTGGPTSSPTVGPTNGPTYSPTLVPTLAPTQGPTSSQTIILTSNPTPEPSPAPTIGPTSSPTSGPTSIPTTNPTAVPTPVPTTDPTHSPTTEPTSYPTYAPTERPTENPTVGPTSSPTFSPTREPTTEPTSQPTSEPTAVPTTMPTDSPTDRPTSKPSSHPTSNPTNVISPNPTSEPTKEPTPNAWPHLGPDEATDICSNFGTNQSPNRCPDLPTDPGSNRFSHIQSFYSADARFDLFSYKRSHKQSDVWTNARSHK
eukprot:scaffold229_cov136-Cylindrotheca_fusiformis.AAC.4